MQSFACVVHNAKSNRFHRERDICVVAKSLKISSVRFGGRDSGDMSTSQGVVFAPGGVGIASPVHEHGPKNMLFFASYFLHVDRLIRRHALLTDQVSK